MTSFENKYISPSAPRMGSAFTRWIGRTVLKTLGWKMTGRLPDVKKAIIIGAPHTSNWDLILAMAAMLTVGLRFSWMMKKEAFFWPLGPLWNVMGGIPIDRSSKSDLTTQMSDWFKNNENVWLGITPEGTRSKVKRFKKGYIRIAKAADVPIFIVGIHGADKTIILDKIWDHKSDNIDLENNAIKQYFDDNFIGINPKNG